MLDIGDKLKWVMELDMNGMVMPNLIDGEIVEYRGKHDYGILGTYYIPRLDKSYSFLNDRFQLVAPAIPFKVGDIVEVAKKNPLFWHRHLMDWTLGKQFVITYINGNHIELLGARGYPKDDKHAELAKKYDDEGYFEDFSWVYSRNDLRLIKRGDYRIYYEDAKLMKKVVKPKKLNKINPDIRAELAKKQATGGICSFALVYEHGIKNFHPAAPCHANLATYNNNDKVVGLVLNFNRFDAYLKSGKHPTNVSMDVCKKHAKAWMDYVMRRSPWAIAFKTKSVKTALEKGIVMNVNTSRHIIAGACVALREATEYNRKSHIFAEMKKMKRWSEDTCFILAMCIDKSPDGKYQQISFGGGHQVFGSHHDANALFKFMKHGYNFLHNRELDKPYKEKHYDYSIEQNISPYTAAINISWWIKENLKLDYVGEGWARKAIIEKKHLLAFGDLVEEQIQKAPAYA